MATDGSEYTSTERKISEQACNVLNELRKKGQLTDVVLKVSRFSGWRVAVNSQL